MVSPKILLEHCYFDNCTSLNSACFSCNIFTASVIQNKNCYRNSFSAESLTYSLVVRDTESLFISISNCNDETSQIVAKQIGETLHASNINFTHNKAMNCLFFGHASLDGTISYSNFIKNYFSRDSSVFFIIGKTHPQCFDSDDFFTMINRCNFNENSCLVLFFSTNCTVNECIIENNDVSNLFVANPEIDNLTITESYIFPETDLGDKVIIKSPIVDRNMIKLDLPIVNCNNETCPFEEDETLAVDFQIMKYFYYFAISAALFE